MKSRILINQRKMDDENSDRELGDAPAARGGAAGWGREPESKQNAEREAEADGGARAAAPVQRRPVFCGGQLAESVGDCAVDWSHGGALRLQICGVQEQEWVRSDGPLRLRGKGRGRDAQAEHGVDSAADVPQHHHLAQEQN